MRLRGWKIWNAKYPGTVAGVNANGYVQLKVFDRNFPAHRIIWKWVHGTWPDCIDHINGDPSDNRLENLRDGSRQMNQRNQKRHCTNTSGRTGVSWNRVAQRWSAQIKMHDISYNLGLYDDFEEAVAARVAAEKKFWFTGRQ